MITGEGLRALVRHHEPKPTLVDKLEGFAGGAGFNSLLKEGIDTNGNPSFETVIYIDANVYQGKKRRSSFEVYTSPGHIEKSRGWIEEQQSKADKVVVAELLLKVIDETTSGKFTDLLSTGKIA